MNIVALKRALFGSQVRRMLAFVLANLAFFGGGTLIQIYVEERASSPGLSIALVALWMMLGLISALFTVISLGNVLLYPGFSERFLQDDLAALDRRLHLAERGIEVSSIEEEDAPLSYSPFRFGFLFVALAAGSLLLSNSLQGGFLQRYTHPGVAIVHLRSPDPQTRRAGLTSLTERLEFKATPAVARAVLPLLDDPDEGVKARAAFVIGTLGIDEGAEPLARMAVQFEALTFTTLISLGQIRTDGARAALMSIKDNPVALREPRALTMALGLAKAPAVERLQQLFREATNDPETRAAAIWALGQQREPRLLAFVVPALEDPELMVRCAAAEALLHMAVFEASPYLRKAFEAVKDPLTQCPEVRVPVQEGGPILRVVAQRNFQLQLVRALHTTDDPELLRWYVEHQDNLESETHALMQESWEKLKEKDTQGKLSHLKNKVRLNKLRDGALPGAPLGGPIAPATQAGDAPATDAPATDAPATDAPAPDAPATDAPASDAPATAEAPPTGPAAAPPTADQAGPASAP